MQPLPMGTITVTAPAKVNLHLEVLGLRDDGFHELAMVMQSIDLADRLTFTASSDARLTLSCDDPSLSVGEDNLVLRAAQLLRSRSGFPELGAAIHLEKQIPIGAGLAGGSSDGAAALLGRGVTHAPARHLWLSEPPHLTFWTFAWHQPAFHQTYRDVISSISVGSYRGPSRRVFTYVSRAWKSDSITRDQKHFAMFSHCVLVCVPKSWF